MGTNQNERKKMLEQLEKKFATVVVPVSEPEPVHHPDRCAACGSSRMWKQRGRDAWRCEDCHPPPSASFVDERCSDEPRVVDTIAVSIGGPWCSECGSWKGIETEWSDGTRETRCWTCSSTMPEWQPLKNRRVLPEGCPRGAQH